MKPLQKLKRLAGRDRDVLRTAALVVESCDAELFSHGERVACELLRLAPAERKAEWYWAGLLHDLGKLAISPEILGKRGVLTARERRRMQKHARKGAVALKAMHAPQVVVDGAMFHHERWDGSGYPSGQRGQDIPLVARVLAVADVFTALTSDRPYRRALTTEQARRAIEQKAGTQFDPGVVRRFFEEQRNDAR